MIVDGALSVDLMMGKLRNKVNKVLIRCFLFKKNFPRGSEVG